VQEFVGCLPKTFRVVGCCRYKVGVDRMSSWYRLRRDLKEDQSSAEWVCFQTVDRKARRVGVNHAFDGH